MNWKLIFLLSLFGLAMGLATVFWIPQQIEPLFWLAIFLICAWIIACSTTPPVLTGVFLGIANSIWITACHLLLFNAYVANHSQEAAMMRSMPAGISPTVLMSVTGPIVGLISGLIIGIFAFVAAKFVKKPAPAAS